MLTDGQGAELVRLARRAVEAYLSESVIISAPESADDRMGVFVTLNYLTRNKEEHLRGCIGFPLPEKQLHQSVIQAAIAAATEDPRFPPVDRKELDNIIFEVSVLTPPEEIKSADRKSEVKVGRDGLILRWKYSSGLLLPQVPVELGWGVDEYLLNICAKAGAPADAWRDPSSKLYRFQAIVFKEAEPKGKIIRLNII